MTDAATLLQMRDEIEQEILGQEERGEPVGELLTQLGQVNDALVRDAIALPAAQPHARP